MDNYIIIYMDNLYWNVNSTYDKCKFFKNNDIVDIDDEYLNNLVFNNNGVIKMILPLNYYSNKESYEIDLFDNREYTIKDILNIIYDFYNRELTDQEYDFITELYNRSNNILTNDYSKVREEYNKILYNVLENKNCKRINLLGSRTIFEGIQQLKDGRYKLLLGY